MFASIFGLGDVQSNQWELLTHVIRDEELRKRLEKDSLDEILDRRRMSWIENVAKMPATLDDNPLPLILLLLF